MTPIIDLFAGPGGLGEGFSKLRIDGKSAFDIRLSIEKEENAHKTLTWRSFYRQFRKSGKNLPNSYYKAYQSQDLQERERLIENTLHSTFEGQLAMHDQKRLSLALMNGLRKRSML